MKLIPIDGKGTGKLGGSVYVISHGVQVKREYHGAISNPSSDPQVAQRSRFKLASQVSASLAPVIVIPRKGLQSPRNIWTKKNIRFFYGSPEGAQVTFENLQITPGSIGLPALQLARNGQNTITFGMAESLVGAIDHVVYSCFKKMDDDSLLLMTSVVVDVTADNDGAVVEIDDPRGELVVYAYGIREKNAKARAIYGNYKIESGQDIAKLVANRTIETDNFQFTQTRGTSIGANQSESVSPEAGKVLLYLTTHGNGTISAVVNGGNAIIVSDDVLQVPIGASVRLTAQPQSGWGFNAWFNNGDQTPLTNVSVYTFTMNGMRDIIASFYDAGGLE